MASPPEGESTSLFPFRLPSRATRQQGGDSSVRVACRRKLAARTMGTGRTPPAETARRRPLHSVGHRAETKRRAERQYPPEIAISCGSLQAGCVFRAVIAKSPDKSFQRPRIAGSRPPLRPPRGHPTSGSRRHTLGATAARARRLPRSSVPRTHSASASSFDLPRQPDSSSGSPGMRATGGVRGAARCCFFAAA